MVENIGEKSDLENIPENLKPLFTNRQVMKVIEADGINSRLSMKDVKN